MVDALASGASVLRDVEVQVLSRVPKEKDRYPYLSFSFISPMFVCGVGYLHQ
jgi:hypothetical protein